MACVRSGSSDTASASVTKKSYRRSVARPKPWRERRAVNPEEERAMDYRRLGSSGLKVSEVGLGCNNFGMRIGQDETNAVVGACLESGVTLFDTADVYGGSKSEVMLARR